MFCSVKIKSLLENLDKMQIQLDITTVLLSLLFGVIWLIRLEGKVKHTEHMAKETQKDVDDLRIRHEALDNKIVEKLAEISERLARIEGVFSKKGE